MIKVRYAKERGAADFGWLKSMHSFSFGDYFDIMHMNFGPLRVLNEDRVVAGAGFSTHGHHDMEIISYVLDGALEHKDSTGTGSVIRPGDIQRMSAGSGILHSEYNHSKQEPVHFLQIWIIPDTSGLEPGYEQKRFADVAVPNQLILVAGPDGGEHAVKIHQNVSLYSGRFDKDTVLDVALAQGRGAWIQVARGNASINGQPLEAGDAAALADEPLLHIDAAANAELLVFDLPLPA